MNGRHWMQIAALASALGLTGGAVAQNSEGTTNPDDRSNASSADAPSSGAIVTPQDKALDMGKDNARAGDGNAMNDDNASPSKGDTVNPGRSNDEGLTVNPGQSTDEEISVSPGEPSADEDAVPSFPHSLAEPDDESRQASPPRTGSDVEPGDMGPGSVRGQ